MAESEGAADMWPNSGYDKPKGADERRVQEIANLYRSKPADKLEHLRVELKRLIDAGQLRIGYQDRADRLRLKIKDRMKKLGKRS